MRLSELEREDMAALAEALSTAGLPTDDLEQSGARFFQFEDGGIAGFAGLQGDGPDRLLRSLVVVQARGRGIGRRIVEALETRAGREGVEQLHVLTTTAAEFFQRLGYARTGRDTAPPSIAATAEFTDLCPASAAYLTKTLAP